MSKFGKNARQFAKPFRVEDGNKFRLKEFDPADTCSTNEGKKSQDMLQQSIALLSEMQEKLYAQDRWALLLIFQAMDAAGKDSTIKHVMSGVNPQGCEVFSFKAPSAEDLDHDFLWRTTRCLPERGRIGIFNRSYYEEVLIVRVHGQLLVKQQLPPHLVTRNIWKERFEDINAFERYLARNGIIVRKFFLHVSKEEQKKRFLARLDNPHKNWKFSLADAREREYWGDYMKAYEAMIRHTATAHAPWYVVPADNKWFTHLVVASAIIDTLDELSLTFPKVDEEKRKELATARVMLEGKDLPVPPLIEVGFKKVAKVYGDIA
jgi:PPK2 family polyphosphate:nucleotide phosphotransferase